MAVARAIIEMLCMAVDSSRSQMRPVTVCSRCQLFMDVLSLVDVKHRSCYDIEVHEKNTRMAPQLVDQYLGHISIMH